MADFDFLTVAGAAIFTPSRPPVYPVEAGNLKNVVAGETLGGKVRSQMRGTDRRTLHLVFPRMTATDIGNFRSLHATYGAMKAPFKIAVSASEFPGIGAPMNLQVRWQDKQLIHPWNTIDRYSVEMNLIEDI